MRIRIGAALAAVLLLAAAVNAFTPAEKTTISALRTRITALEVSSADNTAAILELEEQVAALAALEALVLEHETRLDALEAPSSPSPSPTLAAFTFSNIEAVMGPPCPLGSTSCYVDIEWNVEPCATGQVLWGLTAEYGNATTKETALLCFHRQHIGGLEPNKTYHFAVVATDALDALRSVVALG